MHQRFAAAILFLLSTSCNMLDDSSASSENTLRSLLPDPEQQQARQYHEEPADFEEMTEELSPGMRKNVPSSFHREWIMSDAFLNASRAVTADQVQNFLEHTPYGTRSWLANATYNGRSFARILTSVAVQSGINPIVLLARMQVEQSLVSPTSTPSSSRTDWAFGCGCADGQARNEAYRGLNNQLQCAADVLRDMYDRSVAGTGWGGAGLSRSTSDPITVMPANHATAANYAYTPWVLEGQGGAWLTWNVTRRYYSHFKTLGNVAVYDSGCVGGDERPFVGSPCGCPEDCAFYTSTTSKGFCHEGGFCSLSCNGSCPDLSGFAGTFCVEDPEQAGTGICVSKAASNNHNCADLPETQKETVAGFKNNASTNVTKEVCMPQKKPEPVIEPPEPTQTDEPSQPSQPTGTTTEPEAPVTPWGCSAPQLH